MTFQNLFRQIHGARAPITVFAHLQRTSHLRDKQAEREAIMALSNAITRHHVGRALSAARVLLLLVGPSAAIELIQRHGLFRASFGNTACTMRTSIARRYTLQIPLEGPAAEFFKMDKLLVN
ncbi:hypothetical protein [Massilia sp. YMA4]|uniref:Uncharacterized protein n=1 Tax=[Empedobacter] haloabium TaxID=592317 RepID=A0ABZ1URT5_9BURK|nr:hypothetical protein [Massilia sp. YMA4]